MTHEILTHTLETMGDVAAKGRQTAASPHLHGRALDAIRRLTVGRVPPSYLELQADLGLSSKSAVHRLLNTMKDRGLIEFEYGRHRSIRIVDELVGLGQRPTAELLNIRESIDRILISRPPA